MKEAELIVASRVDPNAFISYVFLDGRPQKRFHAAMQDAYTSHDRVVIDCSIEHGKTEQISAWRSCFELGCDCELRFLMLSCKAPLGSKILLQVEQLIIDPESTGGRLHRVFPNLRPEDRPRRMQAWNSKQFIVRRELSSKDPSFEASGLKGTVIGGRKDRIIGDDVMNWQNTFFQTERERSVNWFKSSECMGRVTANGKVVLVNSPWHPEALSDVAVRDMGFKNVSFVACDEEFGNILWKKETSLGRVVGFDKARLLQRRKEMGPIEFDRCFLGKRITGKTQYFDLNVMLSCVDKETPNHKPSIRNGMKVPSDMIPICTIDPAVGKPNSNDTVIFLGGVSSRTGKRRLARLIVGRLGIMETATKVLEVLRFEPRVIFWVEGNAQQKFLIDILRNKKVMATVGATEAEAQHLRGIIRAFQTDQHKADPESGIPAMMADFEAANWEIPECYEVERWFRQALEYRPGRHTGDIMMAAYIFSAKAREFVTGAQKIPDFVKRRAMQRDSIDEPEFAGIRERVF